MTEPGTSGQPRRIPMSVPRVAAIVAGQLRLRILQGELVDGSELPREAVLAEQYQVSRPSLREAIRILETEGLLVVRRGKIGGIVVKSPMSNSAAYHMGLLLQARAVRLKDLATARDLLEPFCAEQAALRGDHSAVGERLRQLNEEAAGVVEDGLAFTDASMRFHQALVDVAGNQTMRIFAGMLESIWSVQERRWARQAAAEASYPSVELRGAVLRAHDGIAKAIEAGDAELTARLTRTHLHASQLYVASEEMPIVRVVDEYGLPRMDYAADRSLSSAADVGAPPTAASD